MGVGIGGGGKEGGEERREEERGGTECRGVIHPDVRSIQVFQPHIDVDATRRYSISQIDSKQKI